MMIGRWHATIFPLGWLFIGLFVLAGVGVLGLLGRHVFRQFHSA